MLVTRKELERSYWKRKPKDYRHIREDGTKVVLHMGANGGTESWPLSSVPEAELLEHWQQYETVESVVKRYSLERTVINPEDWTDRPVPKEFYWGPSFGRDYAMEQEPVLPLSFRQQNEWGNASLAVYVSRELRAIWTCCEGGIDMTVDADDATFEARMESAKAFYVGRFGRNRRRPEEEQGVARG